MFQQEFNFEEGDRQKEFGMLLAAMSRSGLLARAQDLAVTIAKRQIEVNADDVYQALEEAGLDPSGLGPAAGSIFRLHFEFTGRWVKSRRVSNHARSIRVWRLKKMPVMAERKSA